MAGEGKDKLANYRVYFGYVCGLPTKKMHFMVVNSAKTTNGVLPRAVPWQLCNSEAHQLRYSSYDQQALPFSGRTA